MNFDWPTGYSTEIVRQPSDVPDERACQLSKVTDFSRHCVRDSRPSESW